MSQDIPPEILQVLRSVVQKRPRVVIEHIIEHGYVTTAELKELYGYNHPPRAGRDVREQGIPLETFRITGPDGRKIAAYRFGDLSQIASNKLGGRRAFSKRFKNSMIEERGSHCAICNGAYEPHILQIDHRIPYEVTGEIKDAEQSLEPYMLLCGSCNRAKSWSCEHCTNWLELKDPSLCATCYWAHPLDYSHMALNPMRRLDIVWASDEVEIYDQLVQLAHNADQRLQDYIKVLLMLYVGKK